MTTKYKKRSTPKKTSKQPRAESWDFKKLATQVAKQYEKKGKSHQDAQRIGNAVAAKVGIKKFGQKAMTKAAVKGKRGKGKGK